MSMSSKQAKIGHVEGRNTRTIYTQRSPIDKSITIPIDRECLCKYACAFLNSASAGAGGGVLYCGVADDGRVKVPSHTAKHTLQASCRL